MSLRGWLPTKQRFYSVKYFQEAFYGMVTNLIAITFFKRQDHKVGSGTRDPNIFERGPEPLILFHHI